MSDTLRQVEKYLAIHDCRMAGLLLESVTPEVQRLRRIWSASLNIGSRYDQLTAELRVKSAQPCDCWCCGFTAEQKRRLDEVAEKKTAILDRAFGGRHENNRIGGYAEAVFGIKFHLPINVEEGPDGGIDFRLPCKRVPSGILTVDIKGTTHGEFRLPAVRGGSGNVHEYRHDREDFIRRNDHIYVLIQVNKAHAFCKGFAFGSDEFAYVKRFGGDQPGYRPKNLRTNEELLSLMCPEQRLRNSNL